MIWMQMILSQVGALAGCILYISLGISAIIFWFCQVFMISSLSASKVKIWDRKIILGEKNAGG
jgi:hypothetical protein